MSVTAKAVYFGRSAAQGLRHTPFVHGIAVVTIALALFSLGLARGGAAMLESLIASLGSEVALTVYLADGVDDATAIEVAEAIAQGESAQVKLVPPADALTRLSKEVGDLRGVFAQLPENPLPYSVEVSLPGTQSAEALDALAARIKTRANVVEVDYGRAAVERLTAISNALRVGGFAVFILVMLATIVIVAATLQLAIYSRREEIEIQKLVGATDRFVKAPFLLEGALQGVLGALVALLGLWLFSLFAAPELLSLFAFLTGPSVDTAFVTPRFAAELVGIGVGLGLGGSFVAVGRFLRV